MEDYFFLIGAVVTIFAVIVIGMTISKSQKKAEEARILLAKNARKRLAASQKVKKVHWKDDYSIDQGVIDEDHKILFGLVNEFNEGVPSYQNPEQMVNVLEGLTKYTQTHFQREEKLQDETGYAFSEAHKKEHVDLIQKFQGLIQKAMQANENNITDVAVEIASFLTNWLAKHVIGNDLLMKPYVDMAREGSINLEEPASINENRPLERTEAAPDARLH